MRPPHRFKQHLRLLLTMVLMLGFGLLTFASSAIAASPTQQNTNTSLPTVTSTFDFSRLDPPLTNDPPGQVDDGALYYWGVCMACHGDKGQGLTDEWRASFKEDRDCWASGCHGSDTTSFELNQNNPVPGFAGKGKLSRFSNAFELYAFIFESMPWSNPGSLTHDEAWSVTNYLLKLKETHPEGLTLTSANGYAIPVHRTVSLPEQEWPGVLTLAFILLFAAIGMGLKANPEYVTTFPKPNFIHHLHPPSIPLLQARFRYTLGAGGIAVFLCLILLITGFLEMYFYVPSIEQAATSVEIITTLVPYGNLIRNLHYWAAQLLLVATTIHLIRVVLTSAYTKPRQFNFILGLALMVVILFLDFTGYILRWDEGIRWALVVGTNLLKTIPGIGEELYQFVMGGSDVGPATLTRFYTWHIFGLTISAGILMGWHAFRVRRDGGIAVPPLKKREDQRRITRFELLRREVLTMVVVGVILLLFAMLIPAPIGQPLTKTSANTSDSRAPWFFLWIQQLLNYGDPFIWGVLIPSLILFVLGLIPYVFPKAKVEELGHWFPSGNWIAQTLVVITILTLIILTLIAAIT